MPDFIPGLDLGRLFHLEAVKPILDAQFPGLQYSAALIGSASEILGFDTEMSTDHHWGPRVMLFLKEDDRSLYRNAIDEALRQKLPPRFHGYSTNFTLPDAADNNVQHLRDVDTGPINHRVEIHTIRGFLLDYLNFDNERPPRISFMKKTQLERRRPSALGSVLKGHYAALKTSLIGAKSCSAA